MNVISREELKAKLDRRDDFKLVLVMGEWAYQAKHIPGSLCVSTPQQACATFAQDDEIVLYCSDTPCWTSAHAYRLLQEHGYRNVRHYAGGLADWEDAGYPLEGELVHAGHHPYH